jgi:hypothetical protein
MQRIRRTHSLHYNNATPSGFLGFCLHFYNNVIPSGLGLHPEDLIFL